MNAKRALVVASLSLLVLGAGLLPAAAGKPKPKKVVEKSSYFGPGEVAQCANKDLLYGGILGLVQTPPAGFNGPAIGTCFDVPTKIKKFDITTVDNSGGIVIISWNFTDNQGNPIFDGAGNTVSGFACKGPNPTVGTGGGLNNPIPARAAQVYIFEQDPVSAASGQFSTSCPNIGTMPTAGTHTITFHTP